MKSTGLWIADSGVAYAEALMEYVNLRKSHLFHVRICTELRELKRALKEEEMEILLISASWYRSCKGLIRQTCVILLSEGSLPKGLGACPAVYKYQSAENILREIMYYYSEQEPQETYLTGIRKENRVIGVYSPAEGIGKTVFALTLGQILAESQNVLYLNLEECSGLSGIMGGSQWNTADLIYFLRQNKAQFLYRLNSMVRKLDRMDYIPACGSYTDFRQITVEEWQRLLHLIRTQSAYDSVILDIGSILGHEAELLRLCDGIYMPVRQDVISRSKVSQWEHHIQILDSMDIVEKLQKLELPAEELEPDSETELLMLPQQKLGGYIRGLLKE
ncbi:MAG: hypothetical protein Q4C82_09140 [Eubacteriales bacterium]|nr:hypothetical protein [Eubacteriales bacterium]